MIMNEIGNKRYSRHGLWLLFAGVAFPIHLWAILMILNDISWVTERTNLWDALGVASYGLALILFESVLVFLVATLLGYLVSLDWSQAQRIALLITLFMMAAFWGIIGQLFFFSGLPGTKILVDLLARSGHPLWFLVPGAFGVAVVSALIPVYFVLHSKRAVEIILELAERLTALTAFYLIMDVVGIVIIVIRNV